MPPAAKSAGLAAGEPLCLDCYDHTAAAAFNWVAPELWRTFTISLPRPRPHDRAERAGVRPGRGGAVRQGRRVPAPGVIHFHAIIRLDGRGDDFPPPPVALTAEQLADAVKEAARLVHVQAQTGADEGLLLRFGEQIDAQPLTRRIDLDAGQLTAERVASYVAKYATKAAEDLGLGERRDLPDLHHARLRQLTPHVFRLLEAAWDLGHNDDFAGIRRWLHMLGLRGQFATKSRRYSTTLGAIRSERRDHAKRQARVQLDQLRDPAQDADADGEETTLVIQWWEFAGAGYQTAGDAALAASAAARARERRQAAADARRDARDAYAA